MNLLRKVTALCAYGLASAVVPFALWAPGTASAQEGGASAFLDEIVTTARKRSSAEAVQDAEALLKIAGDQVLVAENHVRRIIVDEFPMTVTGKIQKFRIREIVEQELGNLLPADRPCATLLTQIQVDPKDPAFGQPSKPIGPGYSETEAQRLAREFGWSVARDGDFFHVFARVHPTKNFPHVSRATVYNTLHLFVEKGLLRQFALTEGRVVFDPKTDNHHHFIDEDSGRIHDVPWDTVEVSNVAKLDGFEVREYQVVMRGKRTRPRRKS